MRVLAIDSSGLTATVAVVEETQTVAEYTINYKKTHSQTLLPMIDEVVKMTELDLGTIDAIAVAGGPGSFTGLRIGSATAKGLGLALNKPLIHVPTVDGLAYNVFGCEDIICPIMDARRNQVYTGIYTFSKKAGEKEGRNLVEPVFQVIKMQMAVSIEELAERLNLTPPSITAAIQKMEKMDYIKRTPDPHDQRVLRLSLTEKSRAYLEHIKEVSRQIEERIYKGMNTEEKLLLRRLLTQVRDNLVEGRSPDIWKHPIKL